ncbi:MAG: Endolytic peptidoglycan transglycosylase RlpA [Candidatus Erwinia impunctatus]|nr:Endolytic peptidoglycan transglycosylase RlpA [Culicoides impunctatus]
MRKEWHFIALVPLLLTACTTPQPEANRKPLPESWQGPVVEIGGAEPRYETWDPNINKDYTVNGSRYNVISNPAQFSETGFAAWYGDSASQQRTASGEFLDPEALTAAHPTLPIPSYVRVTNLANGRMLVVRVNDRGPFREGRVIDLTRAAGERLNLSNNSRVNIDFINVAPDGTLSGPGTVGTSVAKQSYALPSRPDIQASSQPEITPSPMLDSVAEAKKIDVRPEDNRSLSTNTTMGAPVNSNGFLGAPQPLAAGVLEGEEPSALTPSTSATTQPSVSSNQASASGWVVQAGALSNQARAQQHLNTLRQQFSVTGRVAQQGNIYRVQLGPFSSRQQADTLQQRLAREANIAAFVMMASR